MLGKLPLSAVRGSVDTLVNDLAGENGEVVLQELKKFNKRQPSWLEKKPAKPKKMDVLSLRDTVPVSALDESFDADAFFVTRSGLYVTDAFKSFVLPKAKTRIPATTSIQSFDLVENANDRKLKAELPKNHEVALQHIAEFIKAQEGGTVGPLLTDGYWNLFYFAGLVVTVLWSAGDREWHVGAWLFDDVPWLVGRRVFSSN